MGVENPFVSLEYFDCVYNFFFFFFEVNATEKHLDIIARVMRL